MVKISVCGTEDAGSILAAHLFFFLKRMQFFPVEINFHFYFNSYFFSSVTTGFYFRTFQPRFYEFIKFRLTCSETGFVNYSNFKNFSGLAFPTNFFNPTYFTSQFSTQALFQNELFENSTLNFKFFDYETFNDFFFISFFNEFDDEVAQSIFFPHLSLTFEEEYFSNESPSLLAYAFHSNLLDFSKNSSVNKGLFGPKFIASATFKKRFLLHSPIIKTRNVFSIFEHPFFIGSGDSPTFVFSEFFSSFLFSFKSTTISKRTLIRLESDTFLIHTKFLKLLQSKSIDREDWLYERSNSRKFRILKNSKFKIASHSSHIFRKSFAVRFQIFRNCQRAIQKTFRAYPATRLFKTKSFRRFALFNPNFSVKMFKFLKFINHATTRLF